MEKKIPFYRKYPNLTSAVFGFLIVLVLLLIADRYLGYRTRKFEESLAKNKTPEAVNINGPITKIIRYRDPISNLSGFVRPTKEYLDNVDDLPDKKYPYRVDSNGFLMPSDVYDKPDFRIVFLGGSTTECLFVSEDKRFPPLAAKMLSTKTGLKVNGYNNGLSGNHTMAMNNLLLNKLTPLKPDYAVLMENVNDVNLLLYEDSYWNKNINRSLVLDTGMIAKYNQQFPSRKAEACPGLLARTFPNIHIRIINAIKKIKGGGGAEPPINEWRAVEVKRSVPDTAKIIRDYKSSLLTFITLCKAWGIKPVLMTQQNRLVASPESKIKASMKALEDKGISYDLYFSVYYRFNQVIKDVARAENVLLIDLEQGIPKSKEYIYDVVHMNDRGCTMAAEIISDALAQDIVKAKER